MTPTKTPHATLYYRRMRRDGYSRTYSRHVIAKDTIYSCSHKRCRDMDPIHHADETARLRMFQARMM